MKHGKTFVLVRNVMVSALCGACGWAEAQNLVSNGGFSEQTNGTRVAITSGTGGRVYDSSNPVFTEWRFFSVGAPPISNFTATVVANPVSEGNLALRLDYTNTVGASGVDWGLDRWTATIPVAYGTGYTLAFDAARVGGSTTLQYSITTFTNGISMAWQGGNVVLTNADYRHFAINYMPPCSNATVSFKFKPNDTGTTNWMSLVLDNVSFTPLSILNGSFEAQAVEASKTIPGGGGTVADATTFSNWRLFSVNPPSGSPSSASIMSDASDHNVGLRYDVDITGGSPSDYGFDKENCHIPVSYGTRYKVSFDAAYIGGGSNLTFGIAEYGAAGNYLAKTTSYYLVITNPVYRTYSFFWTPVSNATASVNVSFRLRPQGGFKTSSMKFDNVRLDRAVASVALSNLLQVVDGTAKSVTVETDPPGLAVDVTYDGAAAAPSGLGGYTVIGTVRAANYEPTCVTNTLMVVTPFAPISGGGFENLTLGSMAGGGGGLTNTAGFAPWRLCNAASDGGTYFTGTVVSATSGGTRALRLDLVSPDLANDACALDRCAQGAFVSVNPVARYLVTFDAARLCGSSRFRVTVSEYNDMPSYLGKLTARFFDLPGTNYQTLSFVWSPQSPDVTQIALGFTPWCVATNTSASVLLDNVCLTPLGEVALRGLTQDYDGTAKSVSAVTDPSGLPVALTYNGSAAAPSNGGLYTVVGTVTNSLYACCVTNLFLIKDAGVEQLKTNGSFEAQAVGTAVSIGTAGAIDTKTFSGWRCFSVGSPAVSNFTATIIPDASEGVAGMRLSLINVGGVSADHALDCESVAKMPVSWGTRYKVSFDAAWESDSRKVDVGVAEYKSSGVYAGVGRTFSLSANSTNYQNFSFVWTPVSNVTAWANLAIRQRSSGACTSSVMRFDNVRFDPLVAAVSLNDLLHEYNDASRAATATTDPGGLPVTITYNGSAEVPTAPGRYTVVATVNDAYFTGCATHTLLIRGPRGTVISVR